MKFSTYISGFVNPPGKWVQVFVLDPDDWWCLQGTEAEVKEYTWRVLCQFGENEKSGRGKFYHVIAVTGLEKIARGTKLRTLPENLVKSNTIRVYNSYED